MHMPFDPTREGQLSEKGLGFGYWWVTHKVQVRKATEIALAAIAAPLLVYGIYGFADWYFGSGVAERAAIASLSQPAIDYAGYRTATAPRDLKTEAPLILASGTGIYDMTARVQNPNPRWIAEFDYGFGVGAKRHAMLLPGEMRQLSILGHKSEARPSASRLVIENLAWKRVDTHFTLPNYESWAAERLTIRAEEAALIAPKLTDAVQVWRAEFTVVNDSAFGYYNPRFVVSLISGSRVVGINEVTIAELRPGERRAVAASWYVEPPTVTQIEVKPVLNIFDEQSYIPAGR
jgi:hypothetical protein